MKLESISENIQKKREIFKTEKRNEKNEKWASSSNTFLLTFFLSLVWVTVLLCVITSLSCLKDLCSEAENGFQRNNIILRVFIHGACHNTFAL